jgi:hypothetical protein
MKKFKFNKDYFVSADNDSVIVAGHAIDVGFDSQLSNKVLSNLYNQGKPYVSLENEDEVVIEKQIPNKEKVIINEPKKKEKFRKYKSYKK